MYIRQKHATLHKSFLIFNNQLQNLHLPPKNFNEKCSNRGICQKKCPRVLILKKIVNSTQTFPLACDVVVVPLHKLFSLICQTAIILKDKTQFLLFPLPKNNNNHFKSFLLWGICKSRLYSLDISTYIPILDF